MARHRVDHSALAANAGASSPVAMDVAAWFHGFTRARALAHRDGTSPCRSPMQRRLAFTLVIVLYFAIVAAHQLTPYMVIAQVGGLVVLGLLWRGWMLAALLIVIAGAFLLPRYSLIASEYGGLFSGGNAVDNASGIQGGTNYGAQEFSGKVVDVLGVMLYLPPLVSILRHWRSLGQVAIPAILAFTPFLVFRPGLRGRGYLSRLHVLGCLVYDSYR